MAKDQDEDLKDMIGGATAGVVSTAIASMAGVPLVGPPLEKLLNWFRRRQGSKIVDYIKLVDYKAEKANRDTVKARLGDPEFVSLYEAGAMQAAHAVCEERLDYLAELVSSGLNDEQIDASTQKMLLALLAELTDAQVIILARHSRKFRQDQEWLEKHARVLRRGEDVELGATQASLDDNTLRKHSRAHLERLGLLELDKRGHLRISSLGSLLLVRIGLIEDEYR